MAKQLAKLIWFNLSVQSWHHLFPEDQPTENRAQTRSTTRNQLISFNSCIVILLKYWIKSLFSLLLTKQNNMDITWDNSHEQSFKLAGFYIQDPIAQTVNSWEIFKKCKFLRIFICSDMLCSKTFSNFETKKLVIE